MVGDLDRNGIVGLAVWVCSGTCFYIIMGSRLAGLDGPTKRAEILAIVLYFGGVESKSGN